MPNKSIGVATFLSGSIDGVDGVLGFVISIGPLFP
jgi:hypothetical protein